MKQIALFLLLSFVTKTIISRESINKDYIVTLQQGKVIIKDNKPVLEVAVSLKNTTKDTLHYLTMSCSWQSFYTTNNKNLMVENIPCDKNIPEYITVPPGETNTVLLNLVFKSPYHYTPITFRVGHNIIKVSKKDWFKDTFKKKHLKNIVWSNAISFKSKKPN